MIFSVVIVSSCFNMQGNKEQQYCVPDTEPGKNCNSLGNVDDPGSDQIFDRDPKHDGTLD